MKIEKNQKKIEETNKMLNALIKQKTCEKFEKPILKWNNGFLIGKNCFLYFDRY